MSFFRVGVLLAFGVFGVIGVLVFALGGLGGDSGEQQIGTVTIWGTHEERVMSEILNTLAGNGVNVQGVTYEEQDPETYTQTLVNALAAGTGPDVFLLPHDQIYQFRDKIRGIPFETVSARTFRDNYIDGADVFLAENGVLALPFSVDPLIMYWNRPLLSGAGVAEPPRFWDAFYTYAERVTQRTQSGVLTTSAVALGEYNNIAHATPILSTLITQAGGDIVVQTDDGYTSPLGESLPGIGTSAAEAALRFYTEFSNPVKNVYSWSRSRPEARQAFIAGDLGVYFGFASEFTGIRAANPNLDFDVSVMPQSRDGARRTTYGNMTGLAIPRTADNPNGAARLALLLSGDAAGTILRNQTAIAPARRALLSDAPDDPVRSVVNESAIMSRAWIDPDPTQTDTVFRDMVNTITTGRAGIGEAVRAAERRIDNLF